MPLITIAPHTNKLQMDTMDKLLNELEAKLPMMERQNLAVSQASVGWHIEHTILSAIKMANAVIHSDPSQYRWQFNWRRTLIFATGRIPRGRAKAPAAVMPQSTLAAPNIMTQLDKLRLKLQHLSMLKPTHFFVHPFFGALHVKHTQKTIYLHTLHHLKIINDIVG